MSAIASMMMGKMMEGQFDQMKKQKEVEEIASRIAIMKGYLDKVPSGSGIMAYPQGLLQEGKQLLRMNPELETYEGLREGIMASQTAKKIGADTGALSNPDVQRALKSLPTSYSSTEERAMQFSAIKKILDSMAGKDLGDVLGFE